MATKLKDRATEAVSRSIRLGVSACLLGEPVRYDGRNKRDDYVARHLARHFKLIGICPEVAIGLGVPRPPIRLEGDPARPRAVRKEGRTIDVTAPLQDFGRRTAREMEGISGFIFKSGSPSCGLEVAVFGKRGAVRPGRGLFVRELTKALPWLPAEDESRLNNPASREHFLERVFAYHRWQVLEAGGMTIARLTQFHTRHKLILLAHSRRHYHTLGALIAGLRKNNLDTVAREYARGFMQALAIPATPRKQANVLQHLMGYLKKELDGDDKAELLESIERYRTEQIPLNVPITLLQHHFRRHPDPYVADQLYLYPEDDEAKAKFT